MAALNYKYCILRKRHSQNPIRRTQHKAQRHNIALAPARLGLGQISLVGGVAQKERLIIGKGGRDAKASEGKESGYAKTVIQKQRRNNQQQIATQHKQQKQNNKQDEKKRTKGKK